MSEEFIHRNEIIKTCVRMRDNAFVLGTYGNISVRLEDGTVLITPSAADYSVMNSGDLVLVTQKGEVLSGRKPSSELLLHLEIYASRPEINSVIHCHPLYSLSASLNGAIPPITEEQCQLIGGELPCTKEYIPCSEHERLAKSAVEALGNKNAVLLKNHGLVAIGADIDTAWLCCRIAEKTARIYSINGERTKTISESDAKKAFDYYNQVYKA